MHINQVTSRQRTPGCPRDLGTSESQPIQIAVCFIHLSEPAVHPLSSLFLPFHLRSQTQLRSSSQTCAWALTTTTDPSFLLSLAAVPQGPGPSIASFPFVSKFLLNLFYLFDFCACVGVFLLCYSRWITFLSQFLYHLWYLRDQTQATRSSLGHLYLLVQLSETEIYQDDLELSM